MPARWSSEEATVGTCFRAHDVPAPLLLSSDLLHHLPPAARDALLNEMTRLTVRAGETLAREGDVADSYFLIEAGELEVSSGRENSTVGHLGPGSGFGELGLLLGGKRVATVRAATDATLHRLDGASFTRIFRQHRGLLIDLEKEMLLRAVACELGKSSVFGGLPPDVLRWLAPRVERRRAAAGGRIVQQGDPGDCMYLITRGEVQVDRVGPDGTIREVDRLRPGNVFGEGALLTGEARSATVTATMDTEVLRIARADLQELMRLYKSRQAILVGLLYRRQHPKRIEGWRMARQDGRDGAWFVLEDPASRRYVKLSEQSAFLWDLMDGARSVRDLTVAHAMRFQTFAVDEVIDTVLQLHASGFVTIQSASLVETKAAGGSPLQDLGHLLRSVARFATVSVSIPDVDRVFTVLYRMTRPLYTLPGQLVLLGVAISGAIAFGYRILSGASTGDAGVTSSAIALVAGLVVHATLHEAAHGVTAKHYGRSAHEAGVGWYLFVPTAFVDTSEMWMAPKWPRVAVSLAGPYTNIVLASVGAILLAFAEPAWHPALFMFATVGYVSAIVNLNPLIELDGYLALMDAVEIPNLRAKALAFLGSSTVRAETRSPRASRIFKAYGGLTLAYTMSVMYWVVVGYRGYLADVVGTVLAPEAAAAVGWGIALTLGSLILLQAWGDLRPAREGTQFG